MDDEGSWEPFLLEGTSHFPFLPEMFGVSVQSTEMLLLGFETLIMLIIIILLLSPLLEAVCQRTSVIISPSLL